MIPPMEEGPFIEAPLQENIRVENQNDTDGEIGQTDEFSVLNKEQLQKKIEQMKLEISSYQLPNNQPKETAQKRSIYENVLKAKNSASTKNSAGKKVQLQKQRSESRDKKKKGDKKGGVIHSLKSLKVGGITAPSDRPSRVLNQKKIKSQVKRA